MAKICCVCGNKDASNYSKYAGRDYCSKCLEKITASRRNFFRSSGVIEIISLVIVVLIAGIVNKMFNLEENTGLRIFLSLLSAVSVSFVFLILFYRQDRLEPEPKKMIALMFLSGAALPLLIVNPILEAIFSVSNWGNYGFLMKFLGMIFVVGLTTELFKLLLVRYTIFLNKEFDEIVDGVVYMSVVGLGYATALNIQYVIVNNGVDLLVGTIRMATLALIHASISGFIGFYLGKAKFEAGSKFGVAFSLIMSSFIWGLYYITTNLAQTSLSFNAWLELIISSVLSLMIMMLTVGLMRHTIKKVEKSVS